MSFPGIEEDFSFKTSLFDKKIFFAYMYCKYNNSRCLLRSSPPLPTTSGAAGFILTVIFQNVLHKQANIELDKCWLIKQVCIITYPQPTYLE